MASRREGAAWRRRRTRGDGLRAVAGESCCPSIASTAAAEAGEAGNSPVWRKARFALVTKTEEGEGEGEVAKGRGTSSGRQGSWWRGSLERRRWRPTMSQGSSSFPLLFWRRTRGRAVRSGRRGECDPWTKRMRRRRSRSDSCGRSRGRSGKKKIPMRVNRMLERVVGAPPGREGAGQVEDVLGRLVLRPRFPPSGCRGTGGRCWRRDCGW